MVCGGLNCFGGGSRSQDEPGSFNPQVRASNTNGPPVLPHPQVQWQQPQAVPSTLNGNRELTKRMSSFGDSSIDHQGQRYSVSVANPQDDGMMQGSQGTDVPTARPRRGLEHAFMNDLMDENVPEVPGSEGVARQSGTAGHQSSTQVHEVAGDMPQRNQGSENGLIRRKPTPNQHPETDEDIRARTWFDELGTNTSQQEESSTKEPTKRQKLKKIFSSTDQGARQTYLTPQDEQAFKAFCATQRISKKVQNLWEALPIASEQLQHAEDRVRTLERDLARKNGDIEALGKTIKTIVEERRRLEKKVQEKDKIITERDESIARNFQDHENAKGRLRQNHDMALQREKATRTKEVDSLNAQIRKLKEDHKKAMDGEKEKHEKEMKEKKDAHEEETNSLKNKHESDQQTLKSQHQAKIKEAEKRIHSLRVYLSKSKGADTYKPIADDVFQNNFQLLAQRITNLVALVSRPDPGQLTHDADPTNFLARDAAQGGGGGGGGWPKFVRSVCWVVLLRGFFSSPKGLGAFGGPGSHGYTYLNQLVELLNVARDENGDANKVEATRAELFGAFAAGLRRSLTDNNYVQVINANIQTVTDELFGSLQGISSTRLGPSARDSLAQIADDAAMLALEMGSQRAQWVLETCRRGDVVVAGDRFQNADRSWDTERTAVEFMTLPCLVRIGDGRQDASTRAVVKGEFVPLLP